MHTVLLALAAPTAALVVFVIGGFFIQHRLDGPNAFIVVVDRRTYRSAGRRITAALAAGDTARAHAGLVALRRWLRREIHTGPKRRRLEYARALKQWELTAGQAGFAGVVH